MKKRALAQVFSCGFYEISKNIFFTEHLLTTASWNRLHGFDINRRRCRHGHKYTKHKKCLSMMVLIYIKKHLSNIGGSFHEIEGKLKKSVPYKKACILAWEISEKLCWYFY